MACSPGLTRDNTRNTANNPWGNFNGAAALHNQRIAHRLKKPRIHGSPIVVTFGRGDGRSAFLRKEVCTGRKCEPLTVACEDTHSFLVVSWLAS